MKRAIKPINSLKNNFQMAKALKVALMNTSNRSFIGNRVLEDYCVVPLSFGYFSSYLKKYSPDRNIELTAVKSLDNLTGEFQMVGLTTYTPLYKDSLSTIKEIKNRFPDMSVFMGGYHISMLPELLPHEADFGVIGEGEETLKEVLDLWPEYDGQNLKQKLKNGAPFDKIKGLVYFDDGGNLNITERRPLLQINTIPFMDQSILQMLSSRYKSIFSGRGCPYCCPFCSMANFWGQPRYFDSEHVIGEIESILNNDPLTEEITFEDEIFIVNKDRLSDISSSIIRKGFNRIAQFSCLIRADLLDDDICILLKQMNVKTVTLGLESGNNEILKILKPGTTVELNQHALDLLYKYNIKAYAFFILGTPGETEEAMMDTFNFILDNFNNNKLANIGITVLHPLPGTYFWNHFKNKNIVSNDMDWGKLSNMAIPLFPKAYSEWRKSREGYSVYLNDMVPQGRFYDLLELFHNKIIPLIYKKYYA